MSKLRSDELVNMEGDGAPSFPRGATSIEPTADNQVATKLYVDTALSASFGNAVSNTAPTNPAIGSFWTDTSVNPSALKTWDGTTWIEFAGTAAAAVGVVVSLPSLSATNLEHAPATITASAAQVSNATLFITKWYKDDVEIVGATGSTYVATEPGVYRYEERWADDAGNVLTPSLNKTIELLAIEAPSITIPVAGTGLPDFDYTAESSAIANVGTVDALGDEEAFNTYLAPTSVSDQALNIDNGMDFATHGGLIWLKSRGGSKNHVLYDSERGAGYALYTNSNSAQGYTNGPPHANSFDSDGFTWGSENNFHPTGQNYVAWSLLKSQGYFDIVTFTGNGSNQTISHNLGSVPAMMLVKDISRTENWMVYHHSLNSAYGNSYPPEQLWQKLDGNNETSSTPEMWNSTAPTSTEFSVGNSSNTNHSGDEYVAYLFADNPSNEIKCGSYLGNAAGGGSPAVPNQIDCGFRPKFVLIKNVGSSTDWLIFDDQRSNYWLQANSANSESFSPDLQVVFNDNGFSLPTGYHHVNQDNTEHIYLAIGSPKITVSNTQLTLTDTTVSRVSDGSLIGGESIDQVLTVGETVQADTAISTTSTATVFDSYLYTGTGNTTTVTNGIDLAGEGGMVWIKWTSGGAYSVESHCLMDTERSSGSASDQYGTFTPYLKSDSTNAQSNAHYLNFNSDGYEIDTVSSLVNHDSGGQYVSWTFRKAPGFFDVVTYTGDGVIGRTIPHNLGSVPGMIMIKAAGLNTNWRVHHRSIVASKVNVLNSTAGFFSDTQFNNTSPTSTVFSVDNDGDVNAHGHSYVAYVFAEDTPGLIKCGSYTGAGASTQVNVGFQPRWMMIKRADSTGNWVILDKDMDDHTYLKANSNDPQGGVVWNFTSTGVTLVGEWGSLNNSGGQYTYIAIAEDAEVDITSHVYASGTVSASSGNSITLSDVSGTWSTGMKVQGVTTDTKDYPDPIDASAVTFASSQPVVTSGTVSAWDYAEWNLSHDAQFSSVVHEKAVPLTATGTQAGPDDFPIQGGTEYFVRTKYASFLPSGQSDWSAVTRFLTKANVYVDDVFSTYLYEGTGSTQSINNGIDLAGEGGLTWVKGRSDSFDHRLIDTERGANNVLTPNATSANFNNSTIFSSFNSDGFSVATDAATNSSGRDYASWSFRKKPGFFDVVTYTGNGTAGRTISHNLGSVPGMIIVKSLNNSYDWQVYHRSMGEGKYMEFNLTNTESSDTTRWNNTAPTSSEFTVGNYGGTNGSGITFVAYIFAHDDQSFGTNSNESIIKCGSYTGTTSTIDLNLGFEPQWVMIKRATGTASVSTNWVILDNMRGVVTDGYDKLLAANLNHEENGTYLYPNYDLIDFTSTGITIDPNGTQPTSVNSHGETYIYMAIRRPHKPATVATDVFAIDNGSGSSTIPTWDSGFPVDMSIFFSTSGGYNRTIATRLTDKYYLNANNNNGEAADGSLAWDSNAGWGKDYQSNFYSYMFRRAPGFFDVVAYTGTGSATSMNHNLGVAPEMMWIKNRTDSESWSVYHKDKGADKTMWLNDNGAGITHDRFNNQDPTASAFYVKTDNAVNDNGDTYVAYLFASLDGISKVGSYTGTGGNINVDCGFTAGSRFVLIKRTDSSGDWYVWDTAHGIVSGNDPYTLLNTTDAQVTNTDYIDPLNAGFTVTSSAPAELNASGGTYLFLAIA